MVSLINFLVLLLYLYTWIIIIRAVMSWMNPNPNNPLVKALNVVTEPILKPLRALVPPARLGGLDISPILAIVLIQILRYLLLGAIY
jgi:YggT family protein